MVLHEIGDVLSRWSRLVGQEDDEVARLLAELTAFLQNDENERESISTLITNFLRWVSFMYIC
jgi:hypothetical protein